MPPTLSTLPPEILFAILSWASPFDASLPPYHPLYTIAATSKYLCAIVEEYTRSLLAQHTSIKPPKNPKTRAFVCRKKWIRWLTETCRYCGKASKRRAILDVTVTCCSKCDKEKFAKMTMTTAIATQMLSKLDLFTPNVLHPTLPPLTFGTYVCMGGDTLMLSAPDVTARKLHIYALLGKKAEYAAYLKRRIASHDRIILHMNIIFRVSKGRGRWMKAGSVSYGDAAGEAKGPRSMKSAEGRKAYVEEGLEREWADMGMQAPGMSVETAIELE